jgi:SAM-dependent methyltransferase
MRVLEIGCGTGMFTELFAQAGPHIIAVDISVDLLDSAKTRNLAVNQVTFLEKPFEECDVEGPFDAIIGSSILHHLEIEVALSKIHSLLKPGRYMSFAEPNMLNPQVFMERKLKFLPWYSYVSLDETAFVRWKLKKLLLKTGFDNVEISPYDWLHPSTPQSMIPFVRRMGQLMEKIPFLCEFAGSLYIRCRRPLQ